MTYFELLKPVGVVSSCHAIPSVLISNTYWENRLSTSDEWIRSKTGIITRHFAGDNETLCDLASAAALGALKRAELEPKNVDVILFTTITPDHHLPSAALMVKDRIGAINAIPYDLNQLACAGLAYGTHLAAHLLQNTSMYNILVIGGDLMSRIINHHDRSSAVFFGDGVGAFVMSRTVDRSVGFKGWDLGSRLDFAVSIPEGGSAMPITENSFKTGKHQLHMDGHRVWETATDVVSKSVLNVLSKTNTSINDIDKFLIHQAGQHLVEEIVRLIDADSEKVPINVDRLGNTGAGSLPILYSELDNRGELDNSLLLMAAIGAGFAWGSAILRHSPDRDAYETRAR